MGLHSQNHLKSYTHRLSCGFSGRGRQEKQKQDHTLLVLEIAESCNYISIVKKNLPSLSSLFSVGDFGEPLLPSSCSRYVMSSMPYPWNMFLNSRPREDREYIKMDLGMRNGPRSVSHFCLFLCLPSYRQCSRAAVPFQAFFHHLQNGTDMLLRRYWTGSSNDI